MIVKMKFLLVVMAVVCTLNGLQAQQPAFPGADGWGRYVTGGRGGAVIEVTNLYDSGEGSLRAAINQEGPRTIVFLVSGTIHLDSDLKIQKGDVTVAGQTAPGDGICLADYPFKVEAENVIVRYIRSRLGDQKGQEEDAFTARFAEKVIIDHCSFSWSVDETASAYENKDFTMQYCIISESLYHSIHSKGNHGYGGIWGGTRASFHHNLLAHHTSRLPRFNGARYETNWDELVDHRNNVIYNWGFNSAYGGEPSEIDGNPARINMVGNYYKPGPATQSGEKQYRIVEPYYDAQYGYSEWYVDSNEVYGHPDVFDDNWGLGVQGLSASEKNDLRSDTAFPYMMDIRETASSAYETVLAQAGARLPKLDTVDRRVIWEVMNDTAIYGGIFAGSHGGIIDSQTDVGGWPELFTAPVPADNDHDGMPDGWEMANGLDPGDPEDRNGMDLDTGYTNLEMYINNITPYGDFLRPPTELVAELSGLNHVELGWKDNSGREGGFYLERSETGIFHVIDTLPADAVQYADSNLSFGTEYAYRLRAFAQDDSSAYSNTRSVTTLQANSAPGKAHGPSPAHYENNVSVNPVLTWIPGDGAESHIVYFGDSNPPPLIGEQTENNYSPTALENNTSYYWRIDEVNVNGTTEGQVWKFITEGSDAVALHPDDMNGLPFDVYPNPVQGEMIHLEFHLMEAAVMKISLIDIYGRTVRTEFLGNRPAGSHHCEVRIGDLPKGAYLLILHNEKSARTVRILITR